ncbi:MAG TPA: hypothetical protein VMT12_11665 [Syntrophales bacterium]|nr:hypothetical protein [Syntrophales bacterium]
MKKISLLFAVIVFVLAFSMTSHAAYTNIYLSAFQDVRWQDKLTGEIYYNIGSMNSYSYCVDPSTNMPIPGNYFAEKFSIVGNAALLQVAWLVDNYAYSKKGVISGFNANETGTILQLAIYDVIGQPVSPVSGYEALFAKKNEIEALIPKTDLSYLAASYIRFDIYGDSDKGVKYQNVLTPVPIPGVVWLLGSGLIGIIGIRRRQS